MSEYMFANLLNVSPDQILRYRLILAFKCYAFLNWIKLPDTSWFQRIILYITRILEGNNDRLQDSNEDLVTDDRDQTPLDRASLVDEVLASHADQVLPIVDEDRASHENEVQTSHADDVRASHADEDRASQADEVRASHADQVLPIVDEVRAPHADEDRVSHVDEEGNSSAEVVYTDVDSTSDSDGNPTPPVDQNPQPLGVIVPQSLSVAELNRRLNEAQDGVNPNVYLVADEAVQIMDAYPDHQAEERTIQRINNRQTRRDNRLEDSGLTQCCLLVIFLGSDVDFLAKFWTFSMFLVLLFMQRKCVNDVFLYFFCLGTCFLCEGMELIIDLCLLREFFFIVMRGDSPMALLVVSMLARCILPFDRLFSVFYCVFILTIPMVPHRLYLTFSYFLASLQICILHESIIPDVVSALEVLYETVKRPFHEYLCTLRRIFGDQQVR